MNKKSCSFFSATALIVILAIFSVHIFEGSHAGHENFCHEENCHVCLVLQIIHSTQKAFDILVQKTGEFISYKYIYLLIFSAITLVPATLVSQKIKLMI
ncbi:MAG: hypothetical protein J6X78_02215 [Treponema sp.]|nr:hypothetical protein [Treponema sp.]